MDKTTFDFELFKKQAAERLKAGDSFFGRDGVLTPLLKEFVEEALDGELDAHLESESDAPARPNRRKVPRNKHPSPLSYGLQAHTHNWCGPQ